MSRPHWRSRGPARRRRPRSGGGLAPRLAPAPLAAVLALLSACGGSAGGDAKGADHPRLIVSAATSLKTALTAHAGAYRGADVRLGFGGSDELAAQIRSGVRPDVFAAANTKLPAQLYAEGLAERPVVFATNTLVLAVPSAEAGTVRSIADLGKTDIRIAIGAKSVPVGAYARTVLERLPARQRKAILANVRSEEPDVGGVIGKLAQGAVDAGFVYATDVRAAKAAIRAIELPADLQPEVAYAAVVVKGAKQPAAARAFVADLARGAGQAELRAAGFGPPP